MRIGDGFDGADPYPGRGDAVPPATSYPSIEEFYRDRPDRERSGEHDYGVWWKGPDGANWRVSWVEATGEIYAIHLGPTRTATFPTPDGEVDVYHTAGPKGPVVLLGVIPASRGDCDCGSGFHAELCRANPSRNVDLTLSGWAEVCGKPDSLRWVRNSIAWVKIPGVEVVRYD